MWWKRYEHNQFKFQQSPLYRETKLSQTTSLKEVVCNEGSCERESFPLRNLDATKTGYSVTSFMIMTKFHYQPLYSNVNFCFHIFKHRFFTPKMGAPDCMDTFSLERIHRNSLIRQEPWIIHKKNSNDSKEINKSLSKWMGGQYLPHIIFACHSTLT